MEWVNTGARRQGKGDWEVFEAGTGIELLKSSRI